MEDIRANHCVSWFASILYVASVGQHLTFNVYGFNLISFTWISRKIAALYQKKYYSQLENLGKIFGFRKNIKALTFALWDRIVPNSSPTMDGLLPLHFVTFDAFKCDCFAFLEVVPKPFPIDWHTGIRTQYYLEIGGQESC